MKQANVLLYPCNIVGYIRLAMLVIAVAMVGLYNSAGWQMAWGVRLGLGIWLLFCLLILDLVDGYLARKLGHTTKFGALFELTLDLLTHTFVWILSGLVVAPLLIALEWTVGLYMAAFTLRPVGNWKTTLVREGPWLVRLYWQPMRVNLLNDYSNVAHFVFPVSLFIFGSPGWLGYLALPGLIVFEVVGVYMLFTFIKILVAEGQAANG